MWQNVHNCCSPAKVTELQHCRLWIEQQILGFDVPMADPKWMDVSQAPEQLVHVQLHRDIIKHVTATKQASTHSRKGLLWKQTTTCFSLVKKQTNVFSMSRSLVCSLTLVTQVVQSYKWNCNICLLTKCQTRGYGKLHGDRYKHQQICLLVQNATLAGFKQINELKKEQIHAV